MTGDPLLDLAISLVGTALLVGLSLALGAWRNVRVEETSATERLAFDEPDFQPMAWLVSDDGRAAAAVDSAGRDYALVFAVGDSLATRRLKLGSRSVSTDGRAIQINLNELSKAHVRIRASDERAASDWASRLGAPTLG